MAERIIIDAGHNGLTDPGAVYNGRRESDDMLRLAQAVGEILARNGYDVEYTRTGDINQSPAQKAQLANDADADLLISLHRNMAAYPGQYSGVQTLLYDLSGLKLSMAQNINHNLEGTGFRNINIEARPDLAVLRYTHMPALLIEVGFIDSARDNQIFDSRFNDIAQAIADGIMDTLTAADTAANTDMDAAKPLRFAYQPSARTETPPVSDPQTETGMETGMGIGTETEPETMPLPEPSPNRRIPEMPPWQQNAAEEADTAGTAQTDDTDGRSARYRVQVGAFYNLKNAIELEQELKRLGYNTWIVTE